MDGSAGTAVLTGGASRLGFGLARIHRLTLIVGGLPDEQMPSYLGR